MVGPSPPFTTQEQHLDDKRTLRATMRTQRAAHVAGLPAATRALVFLRPPGRIAALAPEGATVGLYHARAAEAPAGRWAQWFFENGRHIALPWFAAADAPMQFKAWRDPFGGSDLVEGPFGPQPAPDAGDIEPALVTVPLLAFTAACDRLGQGGGHYDRWLAAHPQAIAIGLGWDMQCVDALPIEAHDRRLDAVVTPTRLFERET